MLRRRLFGVIAFQRDYESTRNNQDEYGRNVRCEWRGDHGVMMPYLGHVIRGVATLAWITYQRNCACRLHQCERLGTLATAI